MQQYQILSLTQWTAAAIIGIAPKTNYAYKNIKIYHDYYECSLFLQQNLIKIVILH